WDENFYSGRVGGKDFAEKMEQIYRLNDGTPLVYGNGLFMGSYRGRRTVWHSGASGGYRAYFLRFPEQHFSVVCLCNLAGVNREKRVQQIADLYLGAALKSKCTSSDMSPTPLELKSFAGIYRDSKRGNVWRVSFVAGKLWVEFEGTVLELRAVGPTEFETVGYPTEVRLRFEAAPGSGAPRVTVSTSFQLPI